MEEILDDQFLEEEPKRQEGNKWFYFFLVLLLIGAPISSIIAWYDVESIIGSGPTMSGIGIIVFLFALKKKSKKAIFLGLLPLVISIFWFLMVNIFSLSPHDCRINIPTSLSLATLFMIYMGILIFKD